MDHRERLKDSALLHPEAAKVAWNKAQVLTLFQNHVSVTTAGDPPQGEKLLSLTAGQHSRPERDDCCMISNTLDSYLLSNYEDCYHANGYDTNTYAYFDLGEYVQVTNVWLFNRDDGNACGYPCGMYEPF